MIGIARAPGTCGELVQGQINGTNFLITCPINLFSTVKVELNNSGIINAGKDMEKIRQAVINTLRYYDKPELGAQVSVATDIPRGKGMASSTADISATCAAVASALDCFLTPDELADLALGIEPTDGIMFPGITMFDHVGGKIRRILGHAPEIDIIIVDLGGTVDTLSFNANSELDLLNNQKEPKIKLSVDKIENAFATNNLSLLGEAATISAYSNQQILFKPQLNSLLEISKFYGGLGINAAHSGTVVGLLFARGNINFSEVISTLSTEGFVVWGITKLINGGVEVIKNAVGDIHWNQSDIFTVGISGQLRKSMG